MEDGGGRHDGGNEAEELEIDVTAVTRNDSRFVTSSRFIARKKEKKKKREGKRRRNGLKRTD